jgi:nickel transport system permease protein
MIRLSIIGMALVLALLCAMWQPFAPDLTDLAQSNLPAGGVHLLGTDHLGRDLLSRLMAGAANSAFVLVVAGAINVGVGVLAGLAAGLGPRPLSTPIQQLAGFFIVMPSLVVALVITGVTGVTPFAVAVALGIGGWAPYAMLVMHRALEVRARLRRRGTRARRRELGDRLPPCTTEPAAERADLSVEPARPHPAELRGAELSRARRHGLALGLGRDDLRIPRVPVRAPGIAAVAVDGAVVHLPVC